MESLAEIMARVERLAFAQEEERQIRPYAPTTALLTSKSPYRLPFHRLRCSPPPEYIQAEAFLEVSGYFTPSSKRIRRIYTKEKKLREYIDEHGNRRTLMKISANHELGLPITSDLDYYRAFLKICDESVDREGRFRPPIAVSKFSTGTLCRQTVEPQDTQRNPGMV